MTTVYLDEEIIRETPSGSRCYRYRWAENFGRDTSYAHSWGCREKSGHGLVWARPGETFRDAIARRIEESRA